MCFQDRQQHDCMDAGVRAKQEPEPRDAAVERTGMYLQRVLETHSTSCDETGVKDLARYSGNAGVKEGK